MEFLLHLSFRTLMSEKINILDISFDNVSKTEALQQVESYIQHPDKQYAVYTPNSDTLVNAAKDAEFLRILQQGDLVVADGAPIVWASRYLGTPLKQKVSGSTLFYRLCNVSAQKGYKLFLLGSEEGIAQKAMVRMQKKYPGLQISGAFSPSYPFMENKQELEEVLELLRQSDADILFVGLGNPRQEIFIDHYKEHYQIPVSIGIGGTFNFAAGKVIMPPEWIKDMGLAWLFRLVQEPRRLWHRYLVEDMKIIGLIRSEKRKRAKAK